MADRARLPRELLAELAGQLFYEHELLEYGAYRLREIDESPTGFERNAMLKFVLVQTRLFIDFFGDPKPSDRVDDVFARDFATSWSAASFPEYLEILRLADFLNKRMIHFTTRRASAPDSEESTDLLRIMAALRTLWRAWIGQLTPVQQEWFPEGPWL